MDKAKLKNIVEAILTASDRILSLNQLEKILTEKAIIPKKLSDAHAKDPIVLAANDSENSVAIEVDTTSEIITENQTENSNEASDEVSEETSDSDQEVPEAESGGSEATAEKIPKPNNLKFLIKEVIAELQEDYAERATELKEVASGFRFQVRQEYAEHVAKLWEERPSKYSRALLETLVLIAYRQPITRGEIEAIRGVSVSSHIMKTLIEREWVRVIGHRDVPGKPAIYGSTKEFLDYFNLKSLDEMPSLSEIKDLDQVIAPELALDEAALEKAITETEAVIEEADIDTPSAENEVVESEQAHDVDAEVSESVNDENDIDETDGIEHEISAESQVELDQSAEIVPETDGSEQSDNTDITTSQENESDNAELS